MLRRTLSLALGLLLVLPGLTTTETLAGSPGPPRIAHLSTDRSPLAGGVDVTVDGQNFTPDVEVVLGDAVVATVEVVNSGQLRFTVPPMRFAGGRTLSIRTETGVAQTKFHILAPRLEDLPDGYITSVGGGIPYLGDGGPATATGVGLQPTGMAVDAAGNVFVSDGSNHRVRRVDASTGEITTYAGTGTPGFSGDGGPAMAAEMNSPQGLTIDTDGALLIADSLNFRVRRVDPSTRRIENIDLGAFLNPVDLAVASDGSLFVSSYYFSDFADGALIRLNRISGETEILYGGVPIYFGRIGLSSDEQGRILMTLGESGELARYDVDTGTTEVLVEYADAVYDSRDVLSDGPDHCLLSSADLGTVDRIAYATGEITRIAGRAEFGEGGGDGVPAVEANLEYPVAIAFDTEGRLLIADQFGARVRHVDGDGIIDTIAGNGRTVPEEISGPATSASLGAASLAADTARNVFLSLGNRVLRIDGETGELSLVAGTGEDGFGGDGGPATGALLSRPGGIAVDENGNVYVSDAGNRRVRRIDALTGIIQTVAGGVARPTTDNDIPFALFDPAALAFRNRTRLYILDRTFPPRVMALNLRNGRLSVAATFPEGNVIANDMARGPSGNLAVSSYDRIWRIDPTTGTVKVLAGIAERPGSSGDGGLAHDARVSAFGLVFTERGNLMFSNNYFQIPPQDTLSQALRLIRMKGKRIEFVAGDASGANDAEDGRPLSQSRFSPGALAGDRDGNLYIADGGRIRAVRSILKDR